MKKHIVELLMEYAITKGAKDISHLPGLWVNQLDERWLIKCNGHLEEVESIPKLSWYIEFNGWPFAILSIAGHGEMGTGELANEDTLRKAILKQLF